VVVDQGARVALRESLVLGRHREAPGSLRQSLRLETVSGCPLLVDGLDTTDPGAALAWGRAKVLGSVVVWGASLESEPAGERFDAESGAVLFRGLADSAHAVEVADAWSAVVGQVSS
jgi:urease accessory protein